jgi:hypothetical protein
MEVFIPFLAIIGYILIHLVLGYASVAMSPMPSFSWDTFDIPEVMAMHESPTAFARLSLGIHPHDYQIELLENTNRRVIVVWGRQLGKTFTLALYAIWFAVTRAEKRIVILAPRKKQAKIMYGQIQKIIRANKWLKDYCIKNIQSEILFPNGSSIINHTVGKNKAESMKGESVDLLLIDEFELLQHPKDTWGNVQPTTSSTHGKIIIISTPITKRGLFYTLFCLARDILNKLTKDYQGTIPKGKGLTWSLSNRALLDRLGLQFGLPSTYGLYYIRQDTGLPQIDEDTLWEARREFDAIKFKQEYLAMFLDEEISYWSRREMVNAKRYQYNYVTQDKEGDQALCIDWGGTEDSTCMAIMKREIIQSINPEVPCVRLIYRKFFHPYDYPDGECHHDEEIEFIKNFIVPNFNISFIFTDPGTVGFDASRQLRKEFLELGIVVEFLSFNPVGKRKMYGRTKVLMQQGRWLMSPFDALGDDDDLEDQFMSVQYKFSELDYRNLTFFILPGSHDDGVDACCGATMLVDWEIESTTHITKTSHRTIMGGNLPPHSQPSPHRSKLSHVPSITSAKRPKGRKRGRRNRGRFDRNYW